MSLDAPQSLDDATTNCPMCGATVPANAVACTACGESLDARPEVGTMHLGRAMATAWSLMSAEPVAAVGVNLAVHVIRGLYFMISYLFVSVFFMAGFALAGGFDSGRELNAFAILGISLVTMVVGASFFLLGDQWFALGQTAFCLQLVRDRTITFEALFSGTRRLLRTFVVQFLMLLVAYLVWLAVIIVASQFFKEAMHAAPSMWPFGIASSVGSLFLIALLSMIWPYWWVLVEEDAPRLTSVRRAMELTAGHRFLSAALWLLVIGLNVLGAGLLCIGLAFTLPFTQLLLTAVYAQLNPRPQPTATDTVPIG